MQIKNIVFDLGNVLISYLPEEFHVKKGDSPDKIKLYLSEVYGSPEWQKLDHGLMTVETAILSIASRTLMPEQEIARIFDLREELLSEISENSALLKTLKKAHFRLYYISNFPEDLFRILSVKYEFFRLFDGGVVSSDVKLLKPDPEIYRTLLRNHDINPAESLFIDDLEHNVKGAAGEGFLTLHLTQTNRLKEHLIELVPQAFTGS
jgi:glucose-1-phosphatase